MVEQATGLLPNRGVVSSFQCSPWSGPMAKFENIIKFNWTLGILYQQDENRCYATCTHWLHCAAHGTAMDWYNNSFTVRKTSKVYGKQMKKADYKCLKPEISAKY